MTGSMLRGARRWRRALARGPDAPAAHFDGRLRSDLKLDFKRMENVKASAAVGYKGPAVGVPAIRFTRSRDIFPDACNQPLAASAT